jgi:putative NADPH-quinone reductase
MRKLAMHVLIPFAHPRRESLAGAILDRFATGLRASGEHTVEIAGLYPENFGCRFQRQDYAQFRGAPMPEGNWGQTPIANSISQVGRRHETVPIELAPIE